MTPLRLDMDFDAAIVDLDGTMGDTLGDFVYSRNAMLDDLGLRPVQRDRVERLVGKGSEYLIKSVLAFAMPASDAMNFEVVYARAWASYQRHYERINGQ